MIKELFKYILMGILTAFLLVYGLRPSVPYPDYILEPYEHNWLFLIIFIINYYLFIWDIKLGCLMLLSIVTLLYDMLIFTKKNIITEEKTDIIKKKINNIFFIS